MGGRALVVSRRRTFLFLSVSVSLYSINMSLEKFNVSSNVHF